MAVINKESIFTFLQNGVYFKFNATRDVSYDEFLDDNPKQVIIYYTYFIIYTNLTSY